MPAKRTHYVPEVYLREFSLNRKNIWQIEKSTNNAIPTVIRNVGVINKLYEPEAEASLAEFEGWYPMLIKHLTAKKTLNDEIRGYLSALLAIMRARVPSQLDKWEGRPEMFRGHQQSPQNIKMMGMLVEADVGTRVLSSSNFLIIVIEDNKKQSHLITSDNPAGQLFFPLAHKMLLMSLSKSKEIGGEYAAVDSRYIKSLNKMTFDNAENYAFSPIAAPSIAEKNPLDEIKALP